MATMTATTGSHRIEVMAPVGSWESLSAAMQAGADAIYFGVGKLNMRSRSAANFSREDLPEIVATTSRYGIKTYLTVNTVIYDQELDEMHLLLDMAREAGISAIIASDMAVISYCRSIGLEVHISTQCNISNFESVKFHAQFADVMVLARELSLRQIASINQSIRDNNLRGPSGELVRTEIFCHGALCMSVSGKCYLSLDNANLSANRGECLQLCRRQYLVKDMETDTELRVDGPYIMSPKDLCTIGFLDKIVKAGISVLKIEGRGRSADYVKTTVQCYREAAEAIINDSYSQERIADWTHRLSTVFNRGFWDGYYLGRNLGEWSQRYGSQAIETKIYLGVVSNVFGKINVAEARIDTANTLSVGERYMVIGKTTGVYEDVVSQIRVDGKEALSASQGDIISLPVKLTLRRGDKLYKIVTTTDEY